MTVTKMVLWPLPFILTRILPLRPALHQSNLSLLEDMQCPSLVAEESVAGDLFYRKLIAYEAELPPSGIQSL